MFKTTLMMVFEARESSTTVGLNDSVFVTKTQNAHAQCITFTTAENGDCILLY